AELDRLDPEEVLPGDRDRLGRLREDEALAEIAAEVRVSAAALDRGLDRGEALVLAGQRQEREGAPVLGLGALDAALPRGALEVARGIVEPRGARPAADRVLEPRPASRQEDARAQEALRDRAIAGLLRL